MRTHKNAMSVFILLIVAILSLMLLSGIGNSYQGTAASTKRDDPTVIQDGRMTDRQREHSKLYKGFGSGRKLKDVAVEIRAGVKIKRNTPIQGGETVPSPTFSEFLRGLACNADAVVIGVVKEKASQLTEDGDFVFTDYELTIEDILKDNEFAHLVPNINLTLTQPGGKVRLEGYIIEAEDVLFRPLALGERYALFLKFIPSTRAYQSVNSLSTYELRDNKIRVQSEEAVRSELNNEKASSFIEKVRSVADAGCVSKGGKNDQVASLNPHDLRSNNDSPGGRDCHHSGCS